MILNWYSKVYAGNFDVRRPRPVISYEVRDATPARGKANFNGVALKNRYSREIGENTYIGRECHEILQV